MGDRCYLSMRVFNEDLPKLTEMGYGPDEPGVWYEVEDQGDGTTRLADDQANYGYYEHRQAWAEAGIRFEGYHDAGADYGGAVFVGIGGAHFECEGSEGDPVAKVKRDGTIEAGPASEYLAALRRFDSELEAERKPARAPKAVETPQAEGGQ